MTSYTSDEVMQAGGPAENHKRETAIQHGHVDVRIHVSAQRNVAAFPTKSPVSRRDDAEDRDFAGGNLGFSTGVRSVAILIDHHHWPCGRAAGRFLHFIALRAADLTRAPSSRNLPRLRGMDVMGAHRNVDAHA